LFSCKNNSDLKEVQVLFRPSFLHPTKFTIDIKNKTIEQYTFQNSYYVKEWIDSTSYRENRKDTLVVHYQKTFPIDNETLDKFLSELKESQLDSTIQHQRAILDGIGFRVSKINVKNDTISLTSNITRREEESQLEYKLLDAFFELSYKSIDDYDGITVIENIQNYFSYGLPIKKANKNPVEYRIWGSLTGCRDDNQELLDFLKNIPDDKPIIFDLRNGSIAICLLEVFAEYENRKNIYYYGSSDFSYINKKIDEIEKGSDSIEIEEFELNAEIMDLLIENKSKLITKQELVQYKQNLNDRNSFQTKDEVLKTIANNGNRCTSLNSE
jgi:hypothetical protein